MWFVIPYAGEERFVGVQCIHPRDRLVDNDLTGVAVGFADGLPVPHKVFWIAVCRRGIVVGSQRVIETLVLGCSLILGQEGGKMPLAKVPGVVASCFQ